MPTRITIKQLCEDEGLSFDDLLEAYANDSVMPALCSDGCQVEPDGHCPHGHPSLLVALGMI